MKIIATITFTLLLSLLLTSCNGEGGKDLSSTAEKGGISSAILSSEPQSESSVAVSAEVQSLLDEALTFYYKKSYSKAIALCDTVLTMDENAFDAYNVKGIALCYSGKLSEGVPLIQRSLDINPSNAFAYHNIAMSYKIKGDYDATLEWFYKAIALDENYTWSIYGAATIYADRSQNDLALDWLERSIKLEPAIKSLAKGQHHWARLLNNERFISMTAE